MNNRSIYVVKSEAGPIKIGISKNPKKRLDALKTSSPHKLTLKYQISVDFDAEPIERAVHKTLCQSNLSGEWFDTSVEKAIDVIVSEINRYSLKLKEHSDKITDNDHIEWRYTVKLTKDDNGTILVTVPDIPEAITFGEDREDALARASDAIETAIMGMIAAREDIPAAKAKGRDTVALPALSCAKIELYNAMRESKIGKAALAKRLGVALPQIDRLLDIKHQSRLDALERALDALGRSLTIVVKSAA